MECGLISSFDIGLSFSASLASDSRSTLLLLPLHDLNLTSVEEAWDYGLQIRPLLSIIGKAVTARRVGWRSIADKLQGQLDLTGEVSFALPSFLRTTWESI